MPIINTGKCPKCESRISSAEVENIHITENFKNKWRGIILVCPQCRCVLGTAIDPIAIKTDIVEELFERLQNAK